MTDRGAGYSPRRYFFDKNRRRMLIGLTAVTLGGAPMNRDNRAGKTLA
jgi:hypothetical protein